MPGACVPHLAVFRADVLANALGLNRPSGLSKRPNVRLRARQRGRNQTKHPRFWHGQNPGHGHVPRTLAVLKLSLRLMTLSAQPWRKGLKGQAGKLVKSRADTHCVGRVEVGFTAISRRNYQLHSLQPWACRHASAPHAQTLECCLDSPHFAGLGKEKSGS